MIKIKKLLTTVLAVLLMLCMSLGLVGCEYKWEIEEKKIFDVADKVTKHPDYALINDFEYRSADETVVWKDLIAEKIKVDGKTIETTICRTALYLKEPNKTEGGFVAFTYKYGKENSLLGLNKNNQKYAIGIISLDDYSFKIHYIQLPYAKFYIFQIFETHFCCIGEDGDAEEGDSTVYLLLNRNSGKIEQTFDNYDSVKENFTGGLTQIFNKSSYTENDIVYNIASIRDQGLLKSKDGKIEFYSPSYECVIEKSEELKQINEVANANDYDVEATFISNGTELFIVFSKGTDMFGMKCQLVPVVFRCDTSFESFEYIGCMYNAQTYYPERLSIIKLNG